MKNDLTTIDLPHKLLRKVGPILEKAGFKIGTVGGGYGQMELWGRLTNEEESKLISDMAMATFAFDFSVIDDED